MARIYILLLFFMTFTAYVQIADAQNLPYPDRHSTNLKDGWLSCETSANPNAVRGKSHWILYDFGNTYKLFNSTVWNFNTPLRVNSYDNKEYSKTVLPGRPEDGMQDVVIDLSNDGKTWTELGRFTLKMAPGSSFYEGDKGPDFNEAKARYVLITALNNYGGSCYGLSEFIINAEPITTSTQDIVTSVGLKVYPNPFKEKTSLYLNEFAHGEAIVQIVDILGNIIQSHSIKVNNHIETFDINGAGLPSGLYFVNVIQNAGTKSAKMEVIN